MGSGLCKRALVQLSYAIGVPKPLSVFVETYGTEQHGLTATDITNIIKMNFDCRPGAIAVGLALREPKYQETAAYGHFGREAYTRNGIKYFEWENAKDLKKDASMNSKQVTAELASSNYLQKWVVFTTRSRILLCSFLTRVQYRRKLTRHIASDRGRSSYRQLVFRRVART